MNNKGNRYALGLSFGLLILFVAIYAFAEPIPAVNPNWWSVGGGTIFTNPTNFSGTFNFTINVSGASPFTGTNITNVSMFYSTDNITYIFLSNTPNNQSVAVANGFNLTWDSATIDEKFNINLLFLATNVSGGGNPYINGSNISTTLTFGNLSGIGGAASNATYNITGNATGGSGSTLFIDNLAPRILNVNLT